MRWKKHYLNIIIISVLAIGLFMIGWYFLRDNTTDKNTQFIYEASDVVSIDNEVRTTEENNTSYVKDNNHKKLPDNVISEKKIETAEEKIHDKDIESDDNKEKKNECVISVKCHTIFDNIKNFNTDKLDILPSDGVILPETKVKYIEGESVFSLMYRVLKERKIHFEFSDNPMYSSVYVEGIGNIYEFDCGELSGWMYKVNEWFPNYGCSRYCIKPGDRIEWVYTCNLGADVGSDFSDGIVKQQ